MRKLLACAILAFSVLAPAATLADPPECLDPSLGGICADNRASEEMICSFLEEPGEGMSECMLAARANYERCMGGGCT